MRAQRVSCDGIAEALKRDRSTIFREIQRNRSAYDGGYRAGPAGEKTRGRRRRSRRNLRYGPADYRVIERLLSEHFSPQQIVGRAKLEGVPCMSHETIYRWIWADRKRGGTLWTFLRGARKRRRKRYGRYDSRGRLAGKRMIDQRPLVVTRRARLGDWEIDTVRGRGKPCILTLVERKSGLVRIGQLPSATAQHAGRRTVELLRRDLVKTITADNGTEFHIYKQIEALLGIQFYFATPHHAWERGSNENTNGLIRQYLPKGCDMKALSAVDCNRIAEALNNRPRLRLGFKTPNEVYYHQGQISSRIASCGKLFGCRPRKRSDGSGNPSHFVALQM